MYTVGICTVFMPDPTVIITDHDMIKEALIDNAEALSDRPKLELMNIMFGVRLYNNFKLIL